MKDHTSYSSSIVMMPSRGQGGMVIMIDMHVPKECHCNLSSQGSIYFPGNAAQHVSVSTSFLHYTHNTTRYFDPAPDSLAR